MIVAVFGSRTWQDREAIRARLIALPSDAFLVVGDCETGADAMAYDVWKELGRHGRRFIAHWRGPNADGDAVARLGYDPAAGLRRNQRIVEQGRPDLGIGFRMPGRSNGTDDMERRLRASGIPVEMHHTGA